MTFLGPIGDQNTTESQIGGASESQPASCCCVQRRRVMDEVSARSAREGPQQRAWRRPLCTFVCLLSRTTPDGHCSVGKMGGSYCETQPEILPRGGLNFQQNNFTRASS